jgi:biopolymer transport protein ExbD
MAWKPKAGDVMSEPNVIPMADIMLVLLIIFMVVTPMLQKGVSVDMAQVQNPREMQQADQDDAIIIAITRDARIYLGADLVPDLEQLRGRVQDLVAARVDKTVYIRSDARARYGEVVKVVDEVRTAGVDNIGLLTEEIPRGRRTEEGQAPTP